MIKEKGSWPRKRIKWDFIQISQSGPVKIAGDPAEVRFFYNNQTVAGTPASINQVFKMDGYNNYTVGGIAQKYPFELILINNKEEIDATNYNVLLPANDEMTCIIKYLIDDPC